MFTKVQKDLLFRHAVYHVIVMGALVFTLISNIKAQQLGIAFMARDGTMCVLFMRLSWGRAELVYWVRDSLIPGRNGDWSIDSDWGSVVPNQSFVSGFHDHWNDGSLCFAGTVSDFSFARGKVLMIPSVLVILGLLLVETWLGKRTISVLRERRAEGVFCSHCGYDIRACEKCCSECGRPNRAAGEDH